jgi:hypothetical protein
MIKGPALRRLAQNNKGSAILTVVIAMLFVVALGTALLFAAYMGLQVSVSARSEKENFYDASAAMDEIKAGIQDEVLSALKTAYTDALTEYGKGNQSVNQVQTYLENKFMTDLGALAIYEKDAEGAYTGTLIGGVFDVTVGVDGKISSVSFNTNLVKQYYVSEPYGVVALSAGNTVWDADTGSVTVKGLTVKFTSTDGYYSEVSTDLVVAIPDFFTGAAISANLGDYVIVAGNGLVGVTGDAQIGGGVFAGADGIKTLSNGDSLSVSGGRIVTSGAVKAEKNSTVKLLPKAYDIWAREFTADICSTLSVDGSTFVADDLTINGGADVSLAGTYYGFGTDDASTGNTESSSSIFVNGYSARQISQTDGSTKTINSTMNLSGLNQLVLGGVSFINTKSVAYNVNGNALVNSNLATGQSVAVKTDQLAYLVPAEAVTNYKTNPAWVPDGEDIETPVYNNKAYLWTTSDGNVRTLAYYLGITGASTLSSGSSGSIVAYYTQAAGEDDRAVYFFISFTDQDKANEYFRDYFAAKPDTISQYLDIYLELSGNTKMTSITKGSSYQYAGGSWSTVSGTFSDAQSILAKSYSDSYTNYIQSPFYQYVNQEKFDGLNNKTLEFVKDGKTVAVVTDDDYDYSLEKSGDIRFIIAGGNVTISKSFSGIVLAKGTVTVSKSVSCVTDSNIGDAVANLDGTTVTFAQYLDDGILGGSISSEVNYWSPDKLVYYSNWQKN